VAAGALWLGVVGWRALARAGEVSQTLAAAPGRMVAPALVVVVVAVFVAERRWPAVRRPWSANAHLVDLGYLLLFAAVVAPLVTLLETGFGVEVRRHARFLLLGRLAIVPRSAVVVAIVVGIDAMNWAAHVANHLSRSLWRFHALHHSQEDMSVFTTFRTHPLSHVSYLAALLPVLVLGSSGAVPAAALIAYGCLVTLPHANLCWTYGALGRAVVSPAYHRLHHAAAPLDGRGTVNFGFVLVCWDRLAGLAALPTAGPAVPTGIAERPVPLEQGVGRSRVGVVMVRQLAQPFGVHAAMDRRS